MARILAAALSAVTIIGLGIVSLQYRAQELAGDGLSGAEQEALNLTNAVGGDTMTTLGHAMPWLLTAVIITILAVMLLAIR